MKGVFYNRASLSSPTIQVPFDVRIKRYSWDVRGGPDLCDGIIEFPSGLDNRSAIWQLVEYLRYGFNVYNDSGTCVWWGFLNELKINDGRRSYGISLNNMYNRTKCTYELITAGSSTGVRDDTVWYVDQFSDDTYGAKEKVYSMTSYSVAAAEADAQQRLDRAKYPPSIADLAIRNDAGVSVEATFRGWWHILNWIYYINAATTYSSVSAQLIAITETSEFVANAIVLDAASTLVTDYRLGDELLQDELTKLMNAGGDSGQRILSTVDRYRNVMFYDEPVKPTIGSAARYILDDKNNLYTNVGALIDPSECTVGVWAYLKDFEDQDIARNYIISPSPVFIERAVYDVETKQYQPENYGYKSPFEDLQEIEK